jgi:hypothetical protein
MLPPTKKTGAEAVTQAGLTHAIEGCHLLNWGAEGKGGEDLVAAAVEQLQAVNALLSACEEAAQVSACSQCLLVDAGICCCFLRTFLNRF